MNTTALGRGLPALAVLAAALLPAPLLAQKLAIEKTHDVSGKAKRGFLDDVNINEGANKVDLVFCTKATNRRVKFETYHFDGQFNFKSMDESEEPVEKVKRYRGDAYDVPGVTVEPNMMGTLVLRRKQVHYTWDWFWGGYNKKIEILEKVKPRGDNGSFYQYSAHAEYDQTGNVVVITSGKDKLGKGTDPLRMFKEYHVLKFNKDLDLVSDTPIQFDKPQFVVQATKLDPRGDRDEDADDSSDPEYDLGIVFAPVAIQGQKKQADPQATNYTYVRVGADTRQKERVAIASPNSIWLVNGMATFKDGTVAVFGPANDKTDDYFNEDITPQVANEAVRGPLEDKFKAKNFELLKIKDGAVAFITSTPVPEFEQKLQTPPAQKTHARVLGQALQGERRHGAGQRRPADWRAELRAGARGLRAGRPQNQRQPRRPGGRPGRADERQGRHEHGHGGQQPSVQGRDDVSLRPAGPPARPVRRAPPGKQQVQRAKPQRPAPVPGPRRPQHVLDDWRNQRRARAERHGKRHGQGALLPGGGQNRPGRGQARQLRQVRQRAVLPQQLDAPAADGRQKQHRVLRAKTRPAKPCGSARCRWSSGRRSESRATKAPTKLS